MSTPFLALRVITEGLILKRVFRSFSKFERGVRAISKKKNRRVKTRPYDLKLYTGKFLMNNLTLRVIIKVKMSVAHALNSVFPQV